MCVCVGLQHVIAGGDIWLTNQVLGSRMEVVVRGRGIVHQTAQQVWTEHETDLHNMKKTTNISGLIRGCASGRAAISTK